MEYAKNRIWEEFMYVLDQTSTEYERHKSLYDRYEETGKLTISINTPAELLFHCGLLNVDGKTYVFQKLPLFTGEYRTLFQLLCWHCRVPNNVGFVDFIDYMMDKYKPCEVKNLIRTPEALVQHAGVCSFRMSGDECTFEFLDSRIPISCSSARFYEHLYMRILAPTTVELEEFTKYLPELAAKFKKLEIKTPGPKPETLDLKKEVPKFKIILSSYDELDNVLQIDKIEKRGGKVFITFPEGEYSAECVYNELLKTATIKFSLESWEHYLSCKTDTPK